MSRRPKTIFPIGSLADVGAHVQTMQDLTLGRRTRRRLIKASRLARERRDAVDWDQVLRAVADYRDRHPTHSAAACARHVAQTFKVAASTLQKEISRRKCYR
ncbi:MAG: hypothetical protein GEV06_01510 [Luteitalea sp.]|nr:hypothetical protein [Luteitalea sp.]